VLSRLERRSRLRYWAVVRYDRYSSGWTQNFYPEEEARHRRSLLRDGLTILGTFGTAEEARDAVHQEFLRLIDKRREERAPRRELDQGWR
jgi:hypothetical protein